MVDEKGKVLMEQGPRMTTDPQEELFELLDAEGNPTGLVKPRGAVHRDGDWHGAFHVWITWPANGDWIVLLQERSSTKDTMPGRVDVSVGGHYRAGEHPRSRYRIPPELTEPPRREVREELGLDLAASQLVWLGRRWLAYDGPHWSDREVQELFCARLPARPAVWQPDQREVSALLEVPLRLLKVLVSGREESISVQEQRVAAFGGPARSARRRLSMEHLVPGVASYWLAVLDHIERIVRGESALPLILRPRGNDLRRTG